MEQQKMDEIVSALNNNLQFLYDSKNCLMQHANAIKDESLRRLLNDMAESRQKMLYDIQQELTSIDYPREPVGTLQGKILMVFENLKRFFTRSDSQTISKDIQKSEAHLVECYKKMLAFNLDNALRQRLNAHLSAIENEIKSCENIADKKQKRR